VADRTLKLVWEDTNETVSTNGHAWSGIAARAGAVIAIFDTTGSWSRISPDNLVVAGAPPVDPPPVNPPPVNPPPVNPPPVDPNVPPQVVDASLRAAHQHDDHLGARPVQADLGR
jgi:hypothetical protein